MSDVGFTKNARLCHKHEFDSVFRCARRTSTGFLTILFSPNDMQSPRLGLMIAKRVIPKACKRNRLKRLIREAFRHEKAHIGSYDLVVMVQKRAVDQPDFAIVSGIKIAFRRFSATSGNL